MAGGLCARSCVALHQGSDAMTGKKTGERCVDFGNTQETSTLEHVRVQRSVKAVVAGVGEFVYGADSAENHAGRTGSIQSGAMQCRGTESM